MKSTIFLALTAGLALTLVQSTAIAQSGDRNVKIHVNSRWSECSFQLDPALAQSAWHEFTQEAGLAAYFRPLRDAQPMGVGNYEVSLLQWATEIDDTRSAWNDTFVHPNETHWLKESPRLAIPGLTFRTGITDRVDIGAFWIKNPGANYGFYGGQVQYNALIDRDKNWAASARFGFNSLYGPTDLNFTVYGLDVLVSRQYGVYSDWVCVSPYAGVSTYVSHSHEKSALVDLKDEIVPGVQATIGAVAQISIARLAAEYNVAKVSSVSFKVGIGF